MQQTLDWLNSIIWSPALIYLCLALGLYFSIRTRLMQVRGIPEMLRLMVNNKSSKSGVSSFQALAMSLAGRVGTGNIAGVATAIAFGGPGAVFWMWVMAFLGASTSYIECTLAQIYKECDDNGQYRGGPAYYIEKAMGQKWYAWLFAVVTIIACGFLLPIVQINTLSESMVNAFAVPPLALAAVITAGLALIIYGGVKRIATFAEVVVPFMALAYIIVAIVIMALNAERLPAMFDMVIGSAFGDSIAGNGWIEVERGSFVKTVARWAGTGALYLGQPQAFSAGDLSDAVAGATVTASIESGSGTLEGEPTAITGADGGAPGEADGAPGERVGAASPVEGHLTHDAFQRHGRVLRLRMRPLHYQHGCCECDCPTLPPLVAHHASLARYVCVQEGRHHASSPVCIGGMSV